MSLTLPELIESTDKLVWAKHPGFVGTAEEVASVVEAIRAQGFQRLIWPHAPTDVYLPFPNSPFQAIHPALPPRNRTSTDLLALTLSRGETSQVHVGVGFLRYRDRWYFSTTGNNFLHQLSSATVWKDTHVSRSGNER